MGKIRTWSYSDVKCFFLIQRLKLVINGQIWYYDVHTRLYRTDLKQIHLNRKQRQSIKNRWKLWDNKKHYHK